MFIQPDKLKKIYERNSVSEVCKLLDISRTTLYNVLRKNGIATKSHGENIVVTDGWVQETTSPEPIERDDKYTGDLEYDLEDHGIQPGESEDQYFRRMNKKVLKYQEKESLEMKDPKIKGLTKEDSDKVKEISERFKKG